MSNDEVESSFLFRAWVIWLLCSFFLFYKNAIEVSPSVLTADLMKSFEISAAECGLLVACYFIAYLLFQIPAGFLLDKFGARVTSSVAIILCATGSFLFAAAHNMWAAGFGRFLTGTGAAFAFVTCLKLISNWFPSRQFSLMAGLMMSFAMLGAVVGQGPLSTFIQKMEWRNAVGMMGGTGLILASLFFGLVKNNPSTALNSWISQPSTNIINSVKLILKNRQSWWLSIYSSLAFAPIIVFGGLWGISFVTAAFELRPKIAAFSVSLIFFGFALGAPFFGWLSSRIGRRRILMWWGTSTALTMISFIIFGPKTNSLVLSIVFFLFGFTISSFLLSFSMIREISHPALAATAIGIMNTFNALLGVFSDPLTGKFLDLNWQGEMEGGVRIFSVTAYKIAFITLPLYLIVSLVVLLKIKETYGKSSYPNTLP